MPPSLTLASVHRSPFVSRFHTSARLIAVAVTALAVVVLAGWAADVPALKTVLPGLVSMKANTALGMLFAGLALLGRVPSRRPAVLHRAAPVFAAAVLLLGAATTLEYLAGLDLGIDEALVRDDTAAVATSHAGRMGLNSALAFVLVGSALLMLRREVDGHRPAQYLAVLVSFLGLMAALGYAYSAATLTGFASFTSMALHRSLAFLLLGLGVLFAQPGAGFMRPYTSPGPIGAAARRLLLAALLGPFFLGLLPWWGITFGWFAPEFGVAVLVSGATGFLTAVAGYHATTLHRKQRDLDTSEGLRVEAERKLRQQREREVEQLQEVLRFKTDFMNTAAHEFGTPLTPMAIQLHLLARNAAGMTPQQRRSVELLGSSYRRIQRLVADLLDAARLQADAMGLQREPVDLVSLVEEAVESYRESARLAGVDLRVGDTVQLVAEADSDRLGQVVANLLDNALKFTPRGGEVEVSVTSDGAEGIIRVRDTGIGLTRKAMRKLFQPFTQVHDPMTVTKPGTGLGLYVCRGIVELHGGRITVESSGLGKGSTFVLVLPLARLQAKALERAQERGLRLPGRIVPRDIVRPSS